MSFKELCAFLMCEAIATLKCLPKQNYNCFNFVQLVVPEDASIQFGRKLASSYGHNKLVNVDFYRDRDLFPHFHAWVS